MPTTAIIHFRHWKRGEAVSLCSGANGKLGGTTSPTLAKVTCQTCKAKAQS